MVLEKTLESPLDCKKIKPVNPKGNQPLIFIGRTDAEAEASLLWPPDAKSQLTGKDSNTGKDWGQEEKGVTENEMAGWQHWLSGLTLSRLWELVKDREAWRAVVHGVAKRWTWLSDWTTVKAHFSELEKKRWKTLSWRGEMRGGDDIWIYRKEVQSENSKTAKGKIQIIYEGTRFYFAAVTLMQGDNEVTSSTEEKGFRIQNIISSQTVIHIWKHDENILWHPILQKFFLTKANTEKGSNTLVKFVVV